MGFRMSFRSIRENSGAIVLGAVHVLLALSLPFILALIVGCQKIEEEQPDYGPEVAGTEIDLALSKAIHGASFDATCVGQYVKYNVTPRLENEEVTTLLGTTHVEVFDREDTATEAKFMLRITQSERLTGNGQFEVRVTEEPLVLQKVSLVGATSTKAFEAKAVQTAERKIDRITYHNLREFTQTEDAPKAVRERAGCGGLSPCSLEVRYIRFNMVQWYDDGTRQKVAFDFAFSTQTPFLPFGNDFDQLNGLMILDCRSTYVPIERRTVFVRDCLTLEDLQK